MFQLNPKKIRNLFVAISLCFMLLNLVRVAWPHVFGPELLNGVWTRFDLNRESAIPTWFSSMVLLTAALTLAVIAGEKRQMHDRFSRHWSALAVIFVLLSIDEISSIHELFNHPLQTALHTSDAFRFGWVIPYGLFVIIFALAYLPFLYHLPSSFRTLFVLSGTVYVFGALVMEMVGGEILSTFGPGLLHTLEITVEEGCEMLGASFFVYAVLAYLRTIVPRITIGLVAQESLAPEDIDGQALCGHDQLN